MKQHFQWEPGFDCNCVLKQLDECRTVKDGKSSFDANKLAYWQPILNSAVRAHTSVGKSKSDCVSRALSHAATPLSDPAKFLEQCEREFERIRQSPTKRYVVLSHVTYEGPAPVNWVSDGRCRIYWEPSSNGRFLKTAMKSRESLASMRRSVDIPDDMKGLTNLLVHVNAHNPGDAVHVATDALDRLRGVLNLLVNKGRGINPFGFFYRPHAINRFRNGPYRTVHHADGSLAMEMIWYEPRWHHDQPSAKFKEPKEKLRENIMGWWNLSRGHPLADIIIEALLRYCRALDQHDVDATLLGLWGALELLTATQKENYEVTISRVIRLFHDHTVARQIALHVKNRRNSTVHAARSPESGEVEAVLLQAEMLVSRMLFFYLKKGKAFRTQRELIQFLDLPLDPNAVKRKREIIDRYLEYRTS